MKQQSTAGRLNVEGEVCSQVIAIVLVIFKVEIKHPLFAKNRTLLHHYKTNNYY